MCGILAVTGQKDLSSVIERAARMKHRGPDERSCQVTQTGILCHERLSIIDLNTGLQPIQGTRNTWVIHNGEIYNHQQLETDVLQNKYPKKTKSDSEVLIHLYEEFGTAFCSRLDGMFAFVIMDDDKHTFMAARDPIGIKPLYYGIDPIGDFWFASELKTICDVCVELHAFPPGHYFTPETGFVKYDKPGWETEEATNNEFSGIRELLEASVEKRLMCDVPYGVLLSGGLDSSLIASIVVRKHRKTGRPLQTFSIGLNPDAPDLMAAAQVADFIGSTHHEVFFTVEDGIRILDKLIWHLESYDVTTVRASTPMYFLSQYIASKGVKMVLSGEGADELFGGYLYFYNAPTDDDFQTETIRRIRLLSTADVLRADKSTMAHGIEAREPMLDKDLLDKVIRIQPHLKRPYRETPHQKSRIEKFILRDAFTNPEDPYLPDNILWRQKEQFSDGVGYRWIDELKAYCDSKVTDRELDQAKQIYPYNTPVTKEAYYYRCIFSKHFPQESSAKTVKQWIPIWQENTDPSGRANILHEAALEFAQ